MDVEQHDARVALLEKDIAAARSLLADLNRKLNTSTDPSARGRVEVNIEDVQRQLNDWEYELHALTAGKE